MYGESSSLGVSFYKKDTNHTVTTIDRFTVLI